MLVSAKVEKENLNKNSSCYAGTVANCSLIIMSFQLTEELNEYKAIAEKTCEVQFKVSSLSYVTCSLFASLQESSRIFYSESLKS